MDIAVGKCIRPSLVGSARSRRALNQDHMLKSAAQGARNPLFHNVFQFHLHAIDHQLFSHLKCFNPRTLETALFKSFKTRINADFLVGTHDDKKTLVRNFRMPRHLPAHLNAHSIRVYLTDGLD